MTTTPYPSTGPVDFTAIDTSHTDASPEPNVISPSWIEPADRTLACSYLPDFRRMWTHVEPENVG
jgi:hypothetical protein